MATSLYYGPYLLFNTSTMSKRTFNIYRLAGTVYVFDDQGQRVEVAKTKTARGGIPGTLSHTERPIKKSVPNPKLKIIK